MAQFVNDLAEFLLGGMQISCCTIINEGDCTYVACTMNMI